MSDDRGRDRTRDLVKRSAEVRGAVAETLEKVRRSLASLGVDTDRPDAPKVAARPSSPDPDPAAAGAPRGLLPDVSATVDRARAVVARTRRILEETRSHLGGGDGDAHADAPESSEKPRTPKDGG